MRHYRIAWGICIFLLAINGIFSHGFTGLYLLMGVIAVPVISILCTAAVSGIPEITILLPDMCQKSETVTGRIQMKASSRFPIFKLKTAISIKNVLTQEEYTYDFYTRLSGKRQREKEFHISSELCGRIEITLKEAVVYDPLSLWKKIISVSAENAINVLPDTFPMEINIMPGMISDDDSIEYSAEKPGYDISELFGIREYQEGDSMKNIHWKLTGRFDDTLMVKLPSLPLENSIMLLLETSLPRETNHSPKVFDAIAESYITMSQNLIHNGISHKLCWYDHDTQCFFTFTVEDEDDFHSTIGRILSVQYIHTEISAPEHFLQENGQPDQAHMIYMTPAYHEQFASLSHHIHRTAIVFGENVTAYEGEEIRMLPCTPENYRKELCSVSI